MTKHATLGGLVYTTVDSRINNGSDEAMAFITRVKDVDGEQRVNLRVLLDTGADQRLSNVQLLDKRPSEDDDDVDQTVAGNQRVAYWPKR